MIPPPNRIQSVPDGLDKQDLVVAPGQAGSVVYRISSCQLGFQPHLFLVIFLELPGSSSFTSYSLAGSLLMQGSRQTRNQTTYIDFPCPTPPPPTPPPTPTAAPFRRIWSLSTFRAPSNVSFLARPRTERVETENARTSGDRWVGGDPKIISKCKKHWWKWMVFWKDRL